MSSVNGKEVPAYLDNIDVVYPGKREIMQKSIEGILQVISTVSSFLEYEMRLKQIDEREKHNAGL
jgi:hypothetical protein